MELHVTINDEEPMFVQAMIENSTKENPKFDNNVKSLERMHDGETHSFDTERSFWPYGFYTYMHSLRDKHNI